MLGSMFRSEYILVGYVTGSLQCEQMRRMRRWAQERITEDEIKNGAMPMSSRRAMAPGASLQCIVLNTWWPVSAASTAISAVSMSRISPIMMMSGSWRRIDRSALAKVSPISFLTGTWLMPGIWNSTGSSTVTMLYIGLFSSFNAE